ncbi:hypothetical protein LBMAG56_08830 [Verrucomicrobiota bacterium]|nr:hypothetical protein LBMAG56_08830 [Verrucomicrobiota bacterium]
MFASTLLGRACGFALAALLTLLVGVYTIGPAQAVRPQVGGRALAEIRSVPEVADALFKVLDSRATLKSPGKVTLTGSEATGMLVNG